MKYVTVYFDRWEVIINPLSKFSDNFHGISLENAARPLIKLLHGYVEYIAVIFKILVDSCRVWKKSVM